MLTYVYRVIHAFLALVVTSKTENIVPVSCINVQHIIITCTILCTMFTAKIIKNCHKPLENINH